jgi:hypothetical protein
MKTVTSASKRAIQEDNAYWEHHINAQRASGITRASYCRVNHVNYDRFNYWIKKNKQKNQSTASVIPIRLKQEIDHTTASDAGRALCTLKFKSGVTIAVHNQEALSLLLKEIM